MDKVKFCEQLRETCGELEQLEVTITCLEGLMNWCEVCFNNEQERKDYELLQQAHELLLKVRDSYENNY